MGKGKEAVCYMSYFSAKATLSPYSDIFEHKTFVLLMNAIHEQVPEEKTLITPVQCKNLWRQFKAETEYTVTQAIAAQVLPCDPFQQLLCTFCSVPAVAQSFLFCLLLLSILK
jgi:hypothetical protein